MKVEVVEFMPQKSVTEDFVGLAKDFEDEVCFFTETHVTYLGVNQEPFTLERKEAERYGSFTVFNGSITLEN